MSIKEQILKLSETLAPSIEIDTGTATAKVGQDSFLANLPDGIDQSVVQKLDDYRTDYSAAATHAFGMKAIDFLANHKDVPMVKGEFAMGGKDSFETVTSREKKYRDPQNEGQEIVKKGETRSTYIAYAGRNSGQLKVVRNAVAEAAMAKLK